MLRKFVPLAAVFLIAIVSAAIADEVVVPSADRDRVIRLNDGRQIRLQAGKELVRTNDGRLVTRALAEPRTQTTPNQTAPRTAQTAKKESGDRWIYYVGAQGSTRSINRERKVKTENIGDTIDDEDGQIIADGSTYTKTKKRSETGFGAAIGVKDAQEQNYYEFAIDKSGDLTEISLSAAIGFPSFSFIDGKAVPYARALVGMGSEDGISEFDSFAYGLGIGVNYAINRDVEVYGEAGYTMRTFGKKTGMAESTTPPIVVKKYGEIERAEKETRLSIGARYLFY